jgi:hypothetical protein
LKHPFKNTKYFLQMQSVGPPLGHAPNQLAVNSKDTLFQHRDLFWLEDVFPGGWQDEP